MTAAGLLVGFFVTLLLPLHRMRLFGSLIALNFLVIGADFEAMSQLENPDRGLPDSRLTFVGGAMMGASVGYFAGWIRSAWCRAGGIQGVGAEGCADRPAAAADSNSEGEEK